MFLFVFLAEGAVLLAISVGRYSFDATFPDTKFRMSTFGGRDITQQGVGT